MSPVRSAREKDEEYILNKGVGPGGQRVQRVARQTGREV